MPRVEVNVDEYVDVDLDIDDILNECSSHEIDRVVNWVKLNTDDIDGEVIHPSDNPHNMMLRNEFSKLSRNLQMLTTEEEETILKITKRLY